jgi:hypothetical protein
MVIFQMAEPFWTPSTGCECLPCSWMNGTFTKCQTACVSEEDPFSNPEKMERKYKFVVLKTAKHFY